MVAKKLPWWQRGGRAMKLRYPIALLMLIVLVATALVMTRTGSPVGDPVGDPVGSPIGDPGGDPLVAAVGDIACTPTSSAFQDGLGTDTACRHKYVADLLAGKDLAAFLALGDLQYEVGDLAAFNTSYDRWFAPYYDITRPTPGNHEYKTPGASGYYSYFSSKDYAASPGYYSYDVGDWHLVPLNSNCAAVGGCGSTQPQFNWLKADLAANTDQCTLAYWHHPKFNDGEHAGVTNMNWAWNLLYQDDAEIILNGHEHSYQRFVPLSDAGATGDPRGIVEFTSGAGGKSHYNVGTTSSLSAFRNTTDYGVLFLTLHPASADYQWVTEAGAVLDSGTIKCH